MSVINHAHQLPKYMSYHEVIGGLVITWKTHCLSQIYMYIYIYIYIYIYAERDEENFGKNYPFTNRLLTTQMTGF